MRKLGIIFLAMVFGVVVSGCAINFYKGKPEQERKIKQLIQEVDDLEAAKRMLEEQLSKEINDKQVLLQMARGGLVITMTNDILFDSGKAKLKSESHPVLKKVAVILNTNVPERNIGVEGYTDNVPIKHSGWKSNWELSAARATNVLHYLIDNCGVSPERLSAIGYGEYRPVVSNDTKEGRARNRRVEIIILPKEMTKRSYQNTQNKISEEARLEEESKLAAEEIK